MQHLRLLAHLIDASELAGPDPEADYEVILRELYKRTPMQTTFSINLLALVDGEPRTLTLKQALRVYIERYEADPSRLAQDTQLATGTMERIGAVHVVLGALEPREHVVPGPAAVAERGRREAAEVDAGFPDRILWHQAVAAKYPYYDITRVGIYGHSAGGQVARVFFLLTAVYIQTSVHIEH